MTSDLDLYLSFIVYALWSCAARRLVCVSPEAQDSTDDAQTLFRADTDKMNPARQRGVAASRSEADELRLARELYDAAILIELGLHVGAGGHGHDERA